MKTEETTFDRMRTRPRFKIHAHISPEDYERSLKAYLKQNSDKFMGNVNREAAHITVKTETDSYWKPRLTLRAELEDGSTVIRGIFGPSPAVWTFFMFLYFILGILWMVSFTLYFVEQQIKSNDFPLALPVSVGVLSGIFLTWLVSRIGQKKARQEMEMLRDFALSTTLHVEKQ